MFGEGGGVGRLNLSGLALLLGEGLCLKKRESKKINKYSSVQGKLRSLENDILRRTFFKICD